jgi:hypothetical protein
MRKLLFLGSLSLILAFTGSAQQRAFVSASAPPAVVRPMPPAPAASAHIVPAHTPPHAHPVNGHSATAHAKPVAAHKMTSPQSSVVAPTPVLGGSVNSVVGSHGVPSCNRSGSLYGLNACQPYTGVVLPFFGGGIYVPVPYYADSGTPDQGDVQEDASNQPTDSNPQDTDQQASTPAPSRYRASSNDIKEKLSEFVFVQKDGSKLYAVAYSFLNDKLQYVTKEGVRRSVALDSLDLDATQKSNEDLGNRINLPTPLASGVAMNASPAALR